METGLYATKKIVEVLNAKYEYDIDLDIYDNEQYSFVTREQCWLGESGRRCSQSYSGLEDFTLVKPLNQYKANSPPGLANIQDKKVFYV